MASHFTRINTFHKNHLPTNRNNPTDFHILCVGQFLFNGLLQIYAALVCTLALLFVNPAHAQRPVQSFSVHEIAPAIGVYAPDRFETSTALSVRYFYHIDKRYTVGVLIGFARAKQDFLRRATSGLLLQPGSDRVFYNGARATHSFAAGKIEPYAIFHLGLTRLYDEQNFTYGFGIGTQVKINPKFSFRYEFLDYIFSSGRDRGAWTNKNIEVSLVFGYHL